MSASVGLEVVPPLHEPWDPDDSVDFHAARLLVLLRQCGSGTKPGIDGRTKLAKLDFLLRYPTFLERALHHLRDTGASTTEWTAVGAEIEAPMIRYRYGPWDPRYRQFLAFLLARKLITITTAKPERVQLTAAGRRAADDLSARSSFQPLIDRCAAMTPGLSTMTGTALKDLVYDLFPSEVGDLPYWTEIRK
jgi:hypothetical protein